jgi:hypothetical protein
MRRGRVLGLGLTVGLGIVMAASATAAAEAPEFGRCLKQATKSLSNYDNAKCVKTAGEDAGTEAEKLQKGNYQWFPAVVKAKFATAIKPETIVVLESVAGTKLICAGETGAGEYTGLKTAGGIVLKFTGCETSGGKCNSAGEAGGSGRVTTQELSGVLGIWQTGTTMAKDKPGLSLRPATGETVVQIECVGVVLTVRGALILPLAGNAMKLSSTYKLAQAKGRQKPAKFVEGPMEVLEMSALGKEYEQAGLAFAFTLTNEEKVEVSTVL